MLLKLQTSACNVTKSNTPPWVFFTFFNLYKWFQIGQSVSNFPQRTFPALSKKDFANHDDISVLGDSWKSGDIKNLILHKQPSR